MENLGEIVPAKRNKKLIRLGHWDQTTIDGYRTYERVIRITRYHLHRGPKSCKGDYRDNVCHANHETNGLWYCEYCQHTHHGPKGVAFEMGYGVELFFNQKEWDIHGKHTGNYRVRPIYQSTEWECWRDQNLTKLRSSL